jgi:hypothetical protein
LDEKVRTDMKYYDFLYAIQKISQKSQPTQNKIITQVYGNLDVCRPIPKIDRQIEDLDKLLSV